MKRRQSEDIIKKLEEEKATYDAMTIEELEAMLIMFEANEAAIREKMEDLNDCDGWPKEKFYEQIHFALDKFNSMMTRQDINRHIRYKKDSSNISLVI